MSTTSSRPKVITPQTRQAQFPEEFLATSDKILMCIHCNHSVVWTKKSTLIEHLESTKHTQSKLKGRSEKVQMTLEATIVQSDSKKQIILEFVEMMVTCNIPLEKRDKMESWLQKYVPNAGSIPKANTLRQSYLPEVLKKNKQEIKEKIKDQPLSIIIDSSPDRLSRNVVNTIVHCGFTGERFLIDTRFLDNVNNLTLFHTIDNVRMEYGVEWSRISTLVCDSASYNKKLYKTIKEGINPQIGLMRCWTHLLDLVSDIWQDSDLNTHLHSVVAKFQELLNRSGPRKARYLQFLKKEGKSPKSMPTMVLTRWNSWFAVIQYLAEFLPQIKSFLKDEKDKMENSQLVNSLLEILEDSYRFSEVKLLVQFYSENAQAFSDIIEYFETPKGITHQAYNQIMNLRNYLRFNVYCEDFGEAIEQIVNEFCLDFHYWKRKFKELFRKALDKLDLLIKEHELWPFLKEVRVFDPEQLKNLSKNPNDYSIVLPDLASNRILKNQFVAYLTLSLLRLKEKNRETHSLFC